MTDAQIWKIAARICDSLKNACDMPQGTANQKDWEGIEGEWFDYIEDEVKSFNQQSNE